MTTNNTTNGNSFNFTSKESAIALLLDARKGLDAMKEDLAKHESYMSDLCQAMLETFGSADENGKKSLQLDLGDGSQRGHIVVQRGNLYFVRERNSGRPVGSKNKKSTASEAPAVETTADAKPEVVVEEPSVVTEQPSETVAEAAPESAPETVTEQAPVAEIPATIPAGADPVAEAILSVASQAINALKEHARSQAPAAISAAE